MVSWFMDTGFAIALCVRRDKFHAKAASLASDLERDSLVMITSAARVTGKSTIRPSRLKALPLRLAASASTHRAQACSASEEPNAP